MGQSITRELQEISAHFDNFKDEFLKETLIIKEMMGLGYSDFLNMVKEINQMCYKTVDCNGRTLLFIIKGGSDSTILWKQTVQVACVRVIKETKKVEDYKLLTLKQFLQAHKMIVYHIRYLSGETEPEGASMGSDKNIAEPLRRNPISTSMILNQIGMDEAATDLDECIICMERIPEITLPCAHSYCLFCIEQWNVSNKTCPVCRETLENTDDSWVIPEIPDSAEVNAELQKALTGLTTKLS